MQRLTPCLCLAALLLGCPPPPPVPEPDAGIEVDAGIDAGTVIDACLAPPAPPESPRLTDWACPAGWEQVPAYALSSDELDAGAAAPVKACAPPALPTSCPAGQRPSLGSSTCQTVGDPCPAGDWPAAVPATGVVRYVKAGAVGGDGMSAATPFGTITQALPGTPAGGTIVIAKGSYTEYVPVPRAITLLGACAEQTIITAPSRSSSRGTIDIGAAATLKNLQVKGPRPGVWILNNAQFAMLEGVIVRNAELVGVFVSDNGKVQLDDVLIEQTLPDPANGTMGRALQVRTGGQVKGTGVVADKNRDVSITVDGAGCSLDLSDLVVRETQSELASTAYGQGLEVRYGAKATINRGLFEKNRNLAVASDQPGSTVTLTDVVLQDTLAQENNRRFGGGLEAKAGATVSLTRVVVRRNRGAALRLSGSALTATDLVVSQTAELESDGTQGLGLVTDLNVSANLTRAVFARNRVADVLISDPGTLLTLTDTRMRETRSQASDGKWGVGFFVLNEATFVATRLTVERTDDTGGAGQNKGLCILTDLLIHDTGLGGPATVGHGLSFQSGARATVQRARLQGNRRIAIGAHGGSLLQLTDVKVSDTRADPQGYFGRALVVQSGSVGSVTRGEFVRNREAALYAHGAGTQLTVDQATVFDTQPSNQIPQEGRAISVESGASALVTCFLARANREVAANVNGAGSLLTLKRARLVDTIGVLNFGDGLVASQGATAVLEDCEVTGNQSLGLAFTNAQGSLRRTRISSNAVGLYVGEGATLMEVEDPAATVAPLQVQVGSSCVFENNAVRVAATFVAVPSPLVPSPKPAEY